MRDVYYVSKRIAESFKPPYVNNLAIISIRDQNEKVNLNENWKHRLDVTFHDIDKEIEGYDLFQRDHAKQIIEFLDMIDAEEVDVLVIHCHAGISRSAAVAKFAAVKFFIPFQHNYSLYNKHVYSLLMKEQYNLTPEFEDAVQQQRT